MTPALPAPLALRAATGRGAVVLLRELVDVPVRGFAFALRTALAFAVGSAAGSAGAASMTGGPAATVAATSPEAAPASAAGEAVAELLMPAGVFAKRAVLSAGAPSTPSGAGCAGTAIAAAVAGSIADGGVVSVPSAKRSTVGVDAYHHAAVTPAATSTVAARARDGQRLWRRGA